VTEIKESVYLDAARAWQQCLLAAGRTRPEWTEAFAKAFAQDPAFRAAVESVYRSTRAQVAEEIAAAIETAPGSTMWLAMAADAAAIARAAAVPERAGTGEQPRTVPDGSEEREEWGTRLWLTTAPEEVYEDVLPRDRAETRVAFHRGRLEDFPEWTGRCELIRRRVITTPWEPAGLLDVPPEDCSDPHRCRVHRGAYPGAPTPTEEHWEGIGADPAKLSLWLASHDLGHRPGPGHVLAAVADDYAALAERMRDDSPAMARACEATNDLLGLRCDREQGHEGVHIQVDGDATRGWGSATRTEEQK
jgi:hypothetical protein